MKVREPERDGRIVTQPVSPGLRFGIGYQGECKMPGIANRRIAVLATDGVEQVELTEPVKALKGASAHVAVIAPKGGQIQGMDHHQFGEKLAVDHDLASVSADRFDALVLPGGVANPDTLRMIPQAVAFVKHFVDANKPIAAICHGSWTLIEADGVRGHRMTSWPSLHTDLKNAGAVWEDQSVVVDGNLVTSRKPDDLPDFCREMIKLFGGDRTQAAA
jgi:protease I